MPPQVLPTPRRPAHRERIGTVDEVTISPAGDPFYASGRFPRRAADDHDHHQPHACIDGVVYIGHLVHDEEPGEEVEVIESVLCKACLRRCHS
jgi:hypothetical protein